MTAQPPCEDAFCISCGGPDPVVNGECADCVQADLEVVRAPDKDVRVRRCTHCGAVPIRDNWGQPTSLLELIERTAIGSVLIPEELEDVSIGVAVDERDPNTYVVHVDVSGSYNGVEIHGEAPVRVHIEGVPCEACSRRHGGYFEAVVQVRAEGDMEVSDEQAGVIAQIIDEEVTRLGGLSGSQSYLLKADARHGGYDYFFGAKPVAKAVARRVSDRYGASTTTSSTLHGRQDGKDLYRLTLAVRIPRVRPGTVLGYEGEVLQVYARQGNRVLAQTVPEGEGRTVEDRRLEHATILEPERLDVVYEDGGEGQVLDPDSYKAVQVRLPQGVQAGDQVRAVYHDGRWVVMGKV